MNDMAYLFTGYLDMAFTDLEMYEAWAEHSLAWVEFDTMIGTGLSGALVVPVLARQLGKHWAIVRKSEENTHSPNPIEGEIGERWVFVDDFVETGRTRDRVLNAVNFASTTERFRTEYVGTYAYKDDRFTEPDWVEA